MEMKTFYTSCFARQKNDWSKCFSIAVYPPKYYDYGGRYYSDLAPQAEDLHKLLRGQIDTTTYYSRYTKVLDRLDVLKVVADLPDGAILLCHEKPGDPCHRHTVSDWLNSSKACTVTELYNEKERKKLNIPAPNNLLDLFN